MVQRALAFAVGVHDFQAGIARRPAVISVLAVEQPAAVRREAREGLAEEKVELGVAARGGDQVLGRCGPDDTLVDEMGVVGSPAWIADRAGDHSHHVAVWVPDLDSFGRGVAANRIADLPARKPFW